MGGRGNGVILGAAMGMAALLVITAGLLWKGGGARDGREYIEAGVTAGESRDGGDSLGNDGWQSEHMERSGEIEGRDQAQAGIVLGGQEEDQGEGAPISGQDGSDDITADGDTGEQKEVSSSEIVMLFGGDVYFSDHVLGTYDKAGGIHGVLDEGIREEIEKADIFMVNQEFPFTRRGTAAADKQFTFRVPESRMHILQEMGVDIVTLANNHILDFGAEGLLDSCKALDEAGILYVGGGEDFEKASALKTITVGQKIIGFLGMSRVYMDGGWAAGKGHPGVFSTYDTTLPLKAVEEARQQCDFLVVYVHWGVERETEPKEYQRAMGRAYIDAGADLVVGSHPHVLQEPEEYKGKMIVYSLGNFVFGSSIPKTALLKVEWGQEGTQASMISCTSSGGFTRLEQQGD